MSLDGAWVPEDKTEERAMEDLHVVTRRAHRDGMSKERIAALLAFMASAALDPRSEQDDPERSSSDLEEAMDDGPTCPDCGEPVAGHRVEMGGDVHFLPCNCVVNWGELTDEERDELGIE